jgi:zinc protease
MNEPITVFEFSNGLKVFLKEIHSAPIISHWTWYRVGSRYELPGYTGISHWVEHMQFKGTNRFPGTQMDRLISREGGVWNAFTHLDWTTYFETMPANKINIALELEADRMFNSVFDPQEVESERTVIIAEKEGKDNEPMSRLNTAVMEAAFEHHPYRNEVIGTQEDLMHIQREDLYQHYRHYYQPSNTMIAIAGDFDTKVMLEKISSLYGQHPSQKPDHPPIEPENELKGPHEIIQRGPGDTTFIQLAYRSPAAAHPDFFAFTILDSLLSGPASLNMFGGGGTSNKTSRLYNKLVEKELAVGVSGGLQATIDPFVYDITLTLHPESNPEDAIKALDREINQVIERRIRRKEVERAVKQARALFAYGLENITNQAFWMGYSEIFATYNWFTQYLDRLANIKPADVQMVAEKYLNPNKRVVGIYVPEDIQTEVPA